MPAAGYVVAFTQQKPDRALCDERPVATIVAKTVAKFV
jgi:hypothetical protein